EAAIGSNTGGGGLSQGQFAILATAATDIVTLRGLDLDGLAVFASGFDLIFFNGAGVLHLDKVKINNLRGSGNGIEFAPTGAAKLFVTDSHIINNGSSGITGGIVIKPASGIQANVTIERTRIENNFFGLIAD